MVELYQKQQIIISNFLEGKSQRKIAKELGIDRGTVATYIHQYEETLKELTKGRLEGNKLELIDNIVETPKYNSENRSKRKLTDEVIEKIEQHLKDNERKRQIGQRKQQKKKIDIYEALVAENHDIGYVTVSKAINVLSNRHKEAFIKGEYFPGDICEFDWGEVKIFIGEVLRTFQLAIFTSAYGDYRYARLYPKQDALCFNEAHAKFFEHIGGSFKTMVYDNTRVVIKKFVGKYEKEPTETIVKLSLYYGFKFRFCNIYAGNEKGHVERSVEYIRRKAFAFKDIFQTLEEANHYLQSVCDNLNSKKQKGNDGKTAQEMFLEERQRLLPKKPIYESSLTTELRVDKYSTISVDNCHYSVPDIYVGKKIFVKNYSDKILCFSDGNKMAEHTKKSGSNQWIIEIEHYLSTLKKKPGALANSIAFSQARPELKQIYNSYYIEKEKNFIDLLQFLKESSLEKVLHAVKILERISPLDISTEKIKSLIISPQIAVHKEVNELEINQNAREMLKRFNNLIPRIETDYQKEKIVQ